MAALIWGLTFVFQATGMETLGPFGFTAFRFLAGSFALLPFAIWEGRQKPITKIIGKAKGEQKKLMLGVMGLGVFMFLGTIAQQISLEITSVANTAFLTTLYVPLVPIIGLILFRYNINPVRWIAVLIFVIGSWLMSGGSPDEAVVGDIIVAIGAIFWASHVIAVGWLAQRTNAPFQLAFSQTVITAVLSFIVFGLIEVASWHDIITALPEILFTGIMSTALGFTLQLIAQQHCSNAAAAIILSLEGVVAAIAGWVLLGQTLMLAAIIGAIFIFCAVILIELTPEYKRR